MQNQNIELNMTPGLRYAETVHVSQYDIGRPITFTLVEGIGRTAFSMPADATVLVEATKPDGLGVSYSNTTGEVTVSNNVVTFVVPRQFCAAAGEGRGEVRVVSETDGLTVGSANFVLSVERAGLTDDTDVSDTEIPALIALAQAQAESAQDSAESASQSASSASGSASSASTYATSARNSATSAGTSATTASTAATTATNAATTATSAKTAAETAQGHAEDAQEAAEAAQEAAEEAAASIPLTVANNLTTTAAGFVLDARQGKVLAERDTWMETHTLATSAFSSDSSITGYTYKATLSNASVTASTQVDGYLDSYDGSYALETASSAVNIYLDEAPTASMTLTLYLTNAHS